MKRLESGRTTVSEVGEPTPRWTGEHPVTDVDIIALSTNMAPVWIGDHNARAQVGNETGIPLEPGHVYHLKEVDLSTVYVDSTTANLGVTWNAVHDIQ